MKLALMGDIHGNDQALEAVLASAKRLEVEHLLINGDLIGYYFAPKRVMQLLTPWSKTIIRGNHEDMLIRCRKNPDLLKAVTGKYGSGIQIALRELSESQLDMIEALPHPAVFENPHCRILLCHGTPWDNNKYVYPDASSELLAKCAQENYDFIVMGHTHHAMIKTVGNVTIVNPGSVGQPRDRKPGAAWALLDTTSKETTFYRESYDIDGLAAIARKLHPEIPYLSDVLART